MHRMIAGLLAVACPALLMAEVLSHPRNTLLYDQSGRESAMILKCDRDFSNGTLSCDLATQYLRFMDETEYFDEFAEVEERLERMFEEEEDVLGTAATICEDMASMDMEAELIERYESEALRDIGRQYIEQMNAACAADTVEAVKAAFLNMAYIELDQSSMTCTVGFSLSELEFSLSDSGNAWVHNSDSTVGGCDLRTTSTLTPYDNWKWEYQQTRIPLNSACDREVEVLTYNTDSVTVFEAQCSVVNFSALPY